MLRKTVITVASLIGIWALGVSALALIPDESGATAIENARAPVDQVNARVWSIDQDRSGRFTMYVRRPVRSNLEIVDYEGEDS